MLDPGYVVPDPRNVGDPAAGSPEARALYAMAEASLAADIRHEADALDGRIRATLGQYIAGDGPALAAIVSSAPSVAVARHLWRLADAAWREGAAAEGAAIAVTVFAVPLVIVTGLTSGDDGTIAGVLDDPAKLAAILAEGVGLGGNRTFAFANALVSADAIDLARLPEIAAWRQIPDAVDTDPLAASDRAPALRPAPLGFNAGREAVHLRFLVGTALAKPGVDLLSEAKVGAWGGAFAQALSDQLRAGPASVLALPRAPQHLLPAVWLGRIAQREVSAQIFASNAIRKFRGTVGEPTAVISAHRTPESRTGGELRLSLSSPFDSRAAEGFRCPLYTLDRVVDVLKMLIDLLRDCRVTDIRTLAGVHADRAPDTGLPLLFKPDSIPETARVSIH